MTTFWANRSPLSTPGARGRSLVFGLLLPALLLAALPASAPLPTAAAPLAVTALRYGSSGYREHQLFAGGDRQRRRTIAWGLVLVDAAPRRLLIDSGFIDPARARRYRIDDFEPPPTLLARLGVAPETITDVIITHRHFDHAGGVDAYPNARVHLHRNAWRALQRRDIVRDATRRFLADKQRRGELVLFDRSYLWSDQVRAEHVGGHTSGSSVVWLDLDGVRYLVPGDECYFRVNCTDARPIGATADAAANRRFVTRVRALKRRRGDALRVLATHDPRLYRSFPAVADAPAGRAVQIRRPATRHDGQ